MTQWEGMHSGEVVGLGFLSSKEGCQKEIPPTAAGNPAAE